MKLISLVVAGMIAAPAISATALAAMQQGDVAGKEEAHIIQSLEAAGYKEIEVETEDGNFEVEAKLNGVEVEMEVSSQTGEILSVDEDKEDDS